MNRKQAVNLLRGRRAALGLSQTEVGKRIDKSHSWVSLIENGRTIPSPTDMLLLAMALRCAVSDIFPDKAA